MLQSFLKKQTISFQNLVLLFNSGKASVNWDKMLDYKSDIVNQNTKGIEFLFKKNKIDVIKGWGSIKEPGVIEVNGKTFNSKSIIIATGSEPST